MLYLFIKIQVVLNTTVSKTKYPGVFCRGIQQAYTWGGGEGDCERNEIIYVQTIIAYYITCTVFGLKPK